MNKEINLGKTAKKQIEGITLVVTIIVLLILVSIGIYAIMRNNGITKIEEGAKEEFIEELKDGTRINTSNELHKTKYFEGMEITDFQLTEKDNVTILLGKITNKTDKAVGGYPVDIKVIDKNKNEIVTVELYIKELKPKESTQLNTSATFDYVNAYDFSISKK